MGKLGTFVKVTLAGTLFPTAGFIGYRKREINEIQQRKREEVAQLDAEFDGLGPKYRKLIAAQHHALEEAKEQEVLKVTLWEDRLRRFREETAEFMKYAEVIPAQMKELEELNKMYWLVAKVLQDSRVEEMKFEALCRKIHQALYIGHDILMRPEALTSRDDLLKALEGVKSKLPDPILDHLDAAAQQLENIPLDAQRQMEQQFNHGLELIERTQFSVAGPDQNDLPARLFSKAQQSLHFNVGDSITAITANAPRKFITEAEVGEGLRFADDFVAAAKEGKIVVNVTKVPVQSTPEGVDAIEFMDQWAESARVYVSLQMLTKGLAAYLTAQAVRLGIPQLPALPAVGGQ